MSYWLSVALQPPHLKAAVQAQVKSFGCRVLINLISVVSKRFVHKSVHNNLVSRVRVWVRAARKSL